MHAPTQGGSADIQIQQKTLKGVFGKKPRLISCKQESHHLWEASYQMQKDDVLQAWWLVVVGKLDGD